MCTMTQDWAGRLAAIRAERKRRGLTQAELAALADVAESTIQNLEGAREYTSEPHALRKVEAALHAQDAPHDDTEPLPLADDEGEPAPVLTPRATAGMPLRVQHELAEGEVVDTEIIDLSRGGMKMVVVVTRDPGTTEVDDEQMRGDLREWSRIQRQLRNIAISSDSDDAAVG